jgi:hypothetical protein
LLVQGKDSNAALPLHPHPAPVYHDGKIQALSHWQLAFVFWLLSTPGWPLKCIQTNISKNAAEGGCGPQVFLKSSF